MTRRAIMLLLALGAACDGERPASAAPAPPPTSPVSTPVEVGDAAATGLIEVPAGEFLPLFPGPEQPRSVPVPAFALERRPVSNAQFLAFVGRHPQWRRSAVRRLFADERYLANWASDLDPGADRLQHPVTEVSWFAARAYASWHGRRLPTIAEWERAAAEPLVGGKDVTRAVLDWYGRGGGNGPGPLGGGQHNDLGLRDIHGLCWEWVLDFASAMVTGDARGDSDLQRALSCGAGAANSARPEDYAAFMRLAMRSSLRAATTGRNLGFRCAADAGGKE
ncbi:MAG: formylglycine-generating enzyme family protein [Planctomycetes bacterium]|nr:formylglycine-generating enzyme family protein [Planctomycetota bacterium]